MRQRHVFASHAARLQLAHQMRLGALVAGYHHQSGGVLVQPVNDTGTRHGRQFGVAVEQAIEQRAAPVARAGMGDEPRGLVHHDPLGAFVHHEEFNGLGPRRRGRPSDGPCRARR
ncbi:hypothetical protein G6F23_014351 [Rhizopus arrhizus]|nr:hypothetical protein G6F23_014351 [Rhizopus arrhizus]